MNKIIPFILIILFASCGGEEPSNIHEENWHERSVNYNDSDSLVKGSTYLSIYSSIYSYSEKRTTELTATVSLRNPNKADSIIIKNALYYDTDGQLIRSYFESPIYLGPMETVEIVIHEKDKEGGTGANFIFDWSKPAGIHDPYFEAIMISSSGGQGLSFRTTGLKIEG